MLGLIGGLFLGWGLGANDAANCFGTAVSSRMVSWRRAAIIASVFIAIGAIAGGTHGVHTLQGLTAQNLQTAGIGAVCAGVTIALMTGLKLPVSTSQAVVGALVGIGFAQHDLDLSDLRKVVICWIGTPIGSMLIAAVLLLLGNLLLRIFKPSIFSEDVILRVGLISAGAYGAYALGANNVANVAGFFVVSPSITENTAVIIGAVCIVIGVLTFSKGVMLTVGRGITPLNGLCAFVVVLAQAITVHIYALVGVPVSSSQAVVGAVIGVGLVKGMQIINTKTLTRIFLGWLITPFLSAILAAAWTQWFANITPAG